MDERPGMVESSVPVCASIPEDDDGGVSGRR